MGAARIRLPIISAGRGGFCLDAAVPAWQVGLDEVRKVLGELLPGRVILLTGGEPTMHPQLPEILEMVAVSSAERAGIVSDGLALADRRLTRELMACGLGCVVIQLHSARAAAHDFVTGMAGAARRAILALRTCVDAGLDVEAEIIVTRATAAHLGETAEVLRRCGIMSLHVRWLLPDQVETGRVLCVVARLLPQMRYVAATTKLAAQLGMELSLGGVPECLRMSCGAVVPPPCTDAWILPGGGNGTAPHVNLHGPGLLAACDRCAGAYPCPGAPAEYVRTYGWLEIEVAAARRPR
jgi:hypothetical protein